MKALQRGFTLVELLIVIAIIGLLVSVGYAQYQDARAQARDERRKSDVEQLALAVRLYFERNGEFPCETGSNCSSHSGSANGEIGNGGTIDTLISPYLEKVEADPLGPGDGTYLYYYDGNTGCGGVVTVHAINMEVPSNGNWSSICGSGAEGGANANSYTVIVGDSSG